MGTISNYLHHFFIPQKIGYFSTLTSNMFLILTFHFHFLNNLQYFQEIFIYNIFAIYLSTILIKVCLK